MWATNLKSAMRYIRLIEAKAKFSTLVDDANNDECSIITRHGNAEAVLISFSEWQRMNNIPSFATLLMSAPLLEEDLFERASLPLRELQL